METKSVLYNFLKRRRDSCNSEIACHLNPLADGKKLKFKIIFSESEKTLPGFLLNPFKTGIGDEYIGYFNALGSLVILQNSG